MACWGAAPTTTTAHLAIYSCNRQVSSQKRSSHAQLVPSEILNGSALHNSSRLWPRHHPGGLCHMHVTCL
eukprot:CAMPEP_0202918070 /NCGR_PEP_ID=MMETSP1392-20130828/72598_1 /ASSEMBLY_ACC=CAM_ASM_000868 /TAXON_ID=225041 /ORGANISM="Chlamydomonas chlamydogama, Strain SAG 11-48b" /LENGTH=69 /DNA_ID=CAMNT_0049611017 /DNA_START=313 /DNA_END=522 /DNA_ORIENTATION=-